MIWLCTVSLVFFFFLFVSCVFVVVSWLILILTFISGLSHEEFITINGLECKTIDSSHAVNNIIMFMIESSIHYLQSINSFQVPFR